MVKVLIIEDEPLIIKLYKQALDQSQFEVLSALNGDEGVELAKSQKPNLILLDVMMPEPNGMQVLENLKADEATKQIPVVMFTNLSGKFDVSFAKSKGALDYWVKNEIEPSKLGEKIKAMLQSPVKTS